MNKTIKQILILILAALVFVVLDLSIWNLLIVRVRSNRSAVMQNKSVEVERYIPFQEDNDVFSIDVKDKLSGDLPVVDGAAALLGVYAGFVESIYPSSAVVFENGEFKAPGAMRYTNTRGAYKAIVDGDADVIFCAAPSASQLDYAKENGVELEFVPVGKEAFVFIVNAANPVDGLTLDQIRGIYSGTIRNWKETGGPDRLISAMRRNEGSGSQTALEKVMGDVPIKPDYDAVFGSPIAFSFRYYVTSMQSEDRVKMLSINGVSPDEKHIADGSYPLTSELYAVYRKNEKNENVRLLIDWILSEEGQEVVRGNGYIPVNPGK